MSAEAIILAEIPPSRELPSGILKGNDLLNASAYLFRFILSDDDPRWHIVSGFVQAKKEARFRPLNFENALLAIYLSDAPSFRNGYSSVSKAESLRQFCRAVYNVGAFPILKDSFQAVAEEPELPRGFTIEFARTDRILSGANKLGITGCPEALYQLRMFKDGEYIARIGFNAHSEEEVMVLSVTNMQGVPKGHPYRELSEQCGVKPFNVLLQRVKTLTDVSSIPVVLRGLKNPVHQESGPLYNTVFKHEKIRRFSFKRN
jgi:hypothetical protein